MDASASNRPDLERIRQRVRQKLSTYNQYNFSREQNDLLKCFFDLSQEYDTLDDIYRVCVTVPLESLGVESSLYILDESRKDLQLACDSLRGVPDEPVTAPGSITLAWEPYETASAYVVPVYRKPPRKTEGSPPPSNDDRTEAVRPGLPWHHRGGVMGMFEIRPLKSLSDFDKFFLTKYSNRIGFRLHNKMLAEQNIRHLKFINSLVMDIEHNVIIPNMYFKHLLNQLRNKIGDLRELEELMQTMKKSRPERDGECQRVIDTVSDLRRELMGNHQQLLKHHAHVSLFLESLFRRDHFEKGHLVLHSKRCNVENEVIGPQLEHYAKRLRDKNIKVEMPIDMGNEELSIMVDLGLLSQVYANLFSNAVKYTAEIVDHHGGVRKVMAYGRTVLPEYFGPGRSGVKFNVFTTGPHLVQSEASRLFDEGYRAPNSAGQPGTGHGLSFIRHVIEMHGGEVGYEPVAQGNNIFFILPLPVSEPDSLEDSR